MRYFAVTLAALLWAASCAGASAQEGEQDHIETDRDSFTPATTTAGPRRLILESAYSFIDNRHVADTHSFPELIGRYGVNEWLELRLGSNYEVGGEANSISGAGGETGDLEGGGLETEAKVFYGLKAAVTAQDGWQPRSAVIIHGNTPTSGAETATHLVATYVWGWTLVEGVEWDSAIRYGDAAVEEDHFNHWAPSTVLKAEIFEDWNAHIEYFGIFTDGRDVERSQSYISPGVHYLITPNFEAGVRVGWGVSADAANFFSNFGVGLRF
ncbi:MAG: transporter [Planctomycetales bacterium]|nr:transporter [Planctomycetales bacterium]